VALTIKDSSELNSPGKTGASSQNAENKSGLAPRSNPVCLEVAVTIRSLPGETGGLSQPIREEARTVIVFDNGAVLRSANNLPVGQKVILSNAGRDVVCRVASGHNLPSVKGYLEVEFLENVSDFWSIHQGDGPSPSAPPPAISPVPRQTEILTQALPPPPLRAPSLDTPPKTASVSLGSGPSFDDIPGLVTSTTVVTRDSKPEPTRPASDKIKNVSEYSHSGTADPSALASWDAPSTGRPTDLQAIPMIGEAASRPSRGSAPTHDFLSQGLMAYEKPVSSSGAFEGRTPLILGLAALVLAGVGAVVFVMHRNTAPDAMAKKAAANQPPAQVANPAPTAAEPPLEQAAQAAGDAAARPQPASQPVAIEENLPLAPVSAIPAIVTGPALGDARSDPRADSRSAKRQEKSAVAAKQPEPAAPRRPAIPNLKMGAPSAPSQNLASANDASAPVTEIAATDAAATVPSANLLTAAGRTSTPPAAPSAFPSANLPAPVAAPRTMRSAQLISSTRPAYPATAKDSSVQGTVTVSAMIDATGKVVSTTALSGPMMLRQAAADSVKLWKYSPALVDGKPASSQITVNVEFKLN
jgi:periplasmic protein TonB